jgi:hypothetical protein
VSVWKPDPDFTPLFGLDRSGGINRECKPLPWRRRFGFCWLRLRQAWHVLARGVL